MIVYLQFYNHQITINLVGVISAEIALLRLVARLRVFNLNVTFIPSFGYIYLFATGAGTEMIPMTFAVYR
jgi:hypothetical protein